MQFTRKIMMLRKIGQSINAGSVAAQEAVCNYEGDNDR